MCVHRTSNHMTVIYFYNVILLVYDFFILVIHFVRILFIVISQFKCINLIFDATWIFYLIVSFVFNNP